MATTKQYGNINSVLENPSSLVFPAEGSIRSQIPMWMKFYCIEYNNSALSRAAAVPSVTGNSVIPGLNKLKTSIMVPAPPSFKASTSLAYGPETLSPSNNLYKFLYDNIVPSNIKTKLDSVGDSIVDMINAVTQIGGDAAGGLGFKSNIEKDLTELTFKGGNGSYRSFDVRLYMPCLSVRDSIAAGSIVQSFEALSLPTILSAFSTKTTHFFHPPLWIFGIGPLNSLKFDRDWSGYPQLCVLTNVDVKRTAFETESMSAISDGSGQFKPVAYSLSLGFRELEPSVRQTSLPSQKVGTTIVSRSSAIITTGVKLGITSQ